MHDRGLVLYAPSFFLIAMFAQSLACSNMQVSKQSANCFPSLLLYRAPSWTCYCLVMLPICCIMILSSAMTVIGMVIPPQYPSWILQWCTCFPQVEKRGGLKCCQLLSFMIILRRGYMETSQFWTRLSNSSLQCWKASNWSGRVCLFSLKLLYHNRIPRERRPHPQAQHLPQRPRPRKHTSSA